MAGVAAFLILFGRIGLCVHFVRTQQNTSTNKNTKNMKNKKMTTFVAVDFETMTKDPASICAAGYVKVKDGVIVEQYYTLVKPVDDGKADTFTWLHGLSRETVASAPDFIVAYNKLKDMLSDGSPFVCHWIGADIKFLEACCQHYGLPDIVESYIDTYELSGENLKNSCANYGIDLSNHHDALCDARACAQLLLALQHLPIEPVKPKRNGNIEAKYSDRRISKETYSVPSDDEIINKETIFYKSNCVITGVFDAWDTREELAALLRSLGADINSSISGKTTIVVAGSDAGPKKLQDVEARQAKGQGITLLDEDQLLDILADADVDF